MLAPRRKVPTSRPAVGLSSLAECRSEMSQGAIRLRLTSQYDLKDEFASMKNTLGLCSLLLAVAGLSGCLLSLVPLNAIAQAVDASVHLHNLQLDESFDDVTPPALPPNWSLVGDWFTTANSAASAPNAAFIDDPDFATTKRLFTPAISIPLHAQLRFRHQVSLESTTSTFAFDGVVLEVMGMHSVRDMVDAGGTFVTGGYDHNIPFFGPASTNPLAGRAVWSGSTQGYQEVVVDLPPTGVGCFVFLQWRLGTDATVQGVGYWLDDVQVGVPDEFIFNDTFGDDFRDPASCP
jgi:hypothetical protein